MKKHEIEQKLRELGISPDLLENAGLKITVDTSEVTISDFRNTEVLLTVGKRFGKELVEYLRNINLDDNVVSGMLRFLSKLPKKPEK